MNPYQPPVATETSRPAGIRFPRAVAYGAIIAMGIALAACYAVVAYEPETQAFVKHASPATSHALHVVLSLVTR